MILSYLLCSDLRFDYGFCIIYVRALAKGELTDSDGRKIGKFLTQQAATSDPSARSPRLRDYIKFELELLLVYLLNLTD